MKNEESREENFDNLDKVNFSEYLFLISGHSSTRVAWIKDFFYVESQFFLIRIKSSKHNLQLTTIIIVELNSEWR